MKLTVLLNKKVKRMLLPKQAVTTEHVMSRNFGVSCLQPPRFTKIVGLSEAGLLR